MHKETTTTPRFYGELPVGQFGEHGVVLDVYSPGRYKLSRYVVVHGTTLDGHQLPLVLTVKELHRYGRPLEYGSGYINTIFRSDRNSYCCAIDLMGFRVFLDIPPSIFTSRVSYRMHELRRLYREVPATTFKLYTMVKREVLERDEHATAMPLHRRYARTNLRSEVPVATAQWVQPAVGMNVEKLILIPNMGLGGLLRQFWLSLWEHE
jgi:hypothetical protein